MQSPTMQQEHDDGGPAFARPYSHDSFNDEVCPSQRGMSLRDYYAGKALQGMLADLPPTCYGLNWIENVTRESWALADAMLRARAQR